MGESFRDIIWLPAGKPTPRQIIAAVAARRGMTVKEMLTPTRRHAIAHARQEAMWELSKRTKLSSNQIAQRLGLADHTTVLHGIRRHAERLAEAQQVAA